MLEIIKFVLSDFWVFIGTVILILALAIVCGEIFPIYKKEVHYHDRDEK